MKMFEKIDTEAYFAAEKEVNKRLKDGGIDAIESIGCAFGSLSVLMLLFGVKLIIGIIKGVSIVKTILFGILLVLTVVIFYVTCKLIQCIDDKEFYGKIKLEIKEE